LKSLGKAALSAVGLLAAAMAGMAATQCNEFPPADTPPPPGVVSRSHPSFDSLEKNVQQLLDVAGASGGVTLIELGGDQAQSWSLSGDSTFVAGSTYKLPLLMLESERLASGREKGTDLLCYRSQDWEDGWYTDYEDGDCYRRSELMRRIGQESDNTAGHILVRYEGSTRALNDYASLHGASQSGFYDPNLTTSDDLGRLWANEASGKAGGGAAQRYLYPLLTDTSFEDGIPAGVPDKVTVVHKTGAIDDEVNDAALVQTGPHGAYVLAICTQGLSGDDGWKLLADISRAVWQYESTR
jgi:beta-lactamase class A